MHANWNQLTEIYESSLSNSESEKWKNHRQAEPIIDEAMEETAWHQIDAEIEQENESNRRFFRIEELLVENDVEKNRRQKANRSDDRWNWHG